MASAAPEASEVYAALGLVARVPPDGPVCIEGSFDAEVIRLTREVEEYARALMEADEHARSAPLDVVERELARVRDVLTPAPQSRARVVAFLR